MSKTKTHCLVQPPTGKTFAITQSEDKVITESGGTARARITEKKFSTSADAGVYFGKKEWELLKKGYVLANDGAVAGEPTLHYFVGSGYTGSLSFANTPKGIYIYKHGWFKAPDDQQDFLALIDTSGNLKETIELPKVLAWDIQYDDSTASLLLDLDHSIFEYNLAEGTFSQLADMGKGRTASFIAIAKNNLAYATNQRLIIQDRQKKLVLERPFEVEIIKGSIPFCATLTKSGNMLAFHNKVGEIQLMNTLTGEVMNSIAGTFQMVGQMEFIDNDTVLAVKEEYGVWRMRYFEVKTATELNYAAIELPSYSKDVDYFAFNADQSRLALVQRTKVYVFDFKNKILLYHFEIEHCVRKARPKFIGNLLGFRTDYGCFSLYRI